MGLDISYYSRITKLDCDVDQDGEPVGVTGNYFRAYPNPDFPTRADAVTGGIYSYQHGDGFRAGSYSGYNEWREQLAKLAGYPAIEREKYGVKQMRHDSGAWAESSGPFWELIQFSDCEGLIGPQTSAKLAKDFAQFQSDADSHEDEYFRERYADWSKAFEAASDNGAVTFH